MKSVLAILLLVLVLLQVRLWIGAGSMAEISRLEDEIAEQTEDNAKLEGRNSSLMEEVGDLRNGLDSIEERARNELGLIRQGETFYLIVEEEGKATRQAEPQIESTAPAPEPLIEEVAPEPPPEIAEEDNPYLDIFRDGEEAPEQSRAANEQGAETALPAGQ
jgi:cell division protein FtsB